MSSLSRVRMGVFNQAGLPIEEFTGMLGYDFSGDASIASLPVEGGSFYSANKNLNAETHNVTLGRSGDSAATVQRCIDRLRALKNGTELVTVVTRFKAYTDVNIIKVDYSHKQGNAENMLVVNLALQEVRQASTQYLSMPASNVRGASAASTVDRGRQQPQEPSQSLLSKAAERSGR